MQAPATNRFSMMPGWLLPAAIVTVVAVAVATVVFLAARAAGSDAPPQPDPFVLPLPVEAIDRFTVKQVSGERFSLAKDAPKDSQPGPPVDVALGSATVERLVPATASALTPGSFVTVTGVPNAVRNFSIRSIVVLDAVPATLEGGLGRTKAGFYGHEAAVDANEKPIMAGTVQSVSGSKVTLNTLAGTVELTLATGAPIYRIEASTPGSIREGERLGTRPFAAGAAPAAVLVAPLE